MCSRMTKTPGTTQTPILEDQVQPQTPEYTPQHLLSASCFVDEKPDPVKHPYCHCGEFQQGGYCWEAGDNTLH